MAEERKEINAGKEMAGCLGTIVLWVLIMLALFSHKIWDNVPAFVKWCRWAIMAYGLLVLLGLVWSMIAGKRDEKVISLVLLTIVGLGLLIIRMF